MARPQKCRRICDEPEYVSFEPHGKNHIENNVLTVDEFEVIRLVDHEKQSHEQCASIMDISRTTVTEIYEKARFKIADALVRGKGIVISGGNYRVCQGKEQLRCGKSCWKLAIKEKKRDKEREGNVMKIAVTYKDGDVFQHFGHSEQFKIYEVEKDKIITSKIIESTGFGHGALVGFLLDLGIDVLICGGIGPGAQVALSEAEIQLFAGVKGHADEAVSAFIKGELEYQSDSHCHHHEDQHDCGSHGCH